MARDLARAWHTMPAGEVERALGDVGDVIVGGELDKLVNRRFRRPVG